MTRLTIGLPVYNGEKFLQQKLDSLLNQNYQDFTLIISDNASTDQTQFICQEIKDKRVRYFRQSENIGPIDNFRFVLEKADTEYFAFSAVDDITSHDFFSKNISIFDLQKNTVCSTGQVKHYGERTESIKQKPTDSFFTTLTKMIKQHFNNIQVYSACGSYTHKIRKYLKKRNGFQIFYGVYRTDVLRKSMVSEHITGFDWLTVLNALRYGDFYVIEETMMQRYDGGDSSRGLFEYAKSFDLCLFDTVFLYRRFTQYFIKNMGIGIFIRNLDCFTKLFLDGFFYLGVDIVRKALNISLTNSRTK